MDEKERIRNMVAAGTITRAEAERLLSVLDDIDRAEAELAASGEAMEAQARDAEAGSPASSDAAGAGPSAAAAMEPTRNAGPAPGEGAPGAQAVGSAGPVGRGAAAAAASGAATDHEAAPVATRAAPSGTVAPEGTRWLHVSLLAGDIDVRGDPGTDEVLLSGDTEALRLEPTADGFTLRHEREAGSDSWVDRFLHRLRAGNVHIRVPADYGLDLSVTAGDVDVVGVPYLRGKLTSGNLTARGLSGVDLVTSAGDIDLAMTLTEGRHRLRATAGDVDVRLGTGSSVTVQGSVSIGSASVRAPDFEVDRRGIGQRFEGRVGTGDAELEVHVTTGDIHVRVDDER